jgi:transcriptional regulator with XRE-family HTH domain
MYPMLAQLIRLRRVQRGLTQQQLALLAKVSRRQLALLEQGENVSLNFLVKIAGVLEISELPVDGLRLRAFPPELAGIVEAAHALTLVKDAVGGVASLGVMVESVTAKLDALLHTALAGTPADPHVEDFLGKLADLPKKDLAKMASTMRTLAEGGTVHRARRTRKAAAAVSSTPEPKSRER